MNFEQIKINYKNLELWKRLTFLGIIALLPTVFQLIDEGQTLSEQKDLTRNEHEVSEKKFSDSRIKKENLPKLEEKISFIESEMVAASKKIPDQFFMDQVLQKTALIAQDVGVDLRKFDPGKEMPSETAYKYVTLPIKIEVVGTFSQIATYFDHVAHLDLLVHIKNFDLSLSSEKDLDSSTGMSTEQIQQKMRSEAKVIGRADMVIYRTLSQQEAAMMEEKTRMKEDAKKKKDKKSGKPEKNEKQDAKILKSEGEISENTEQESAEKTVRL